ncbi:MAG TPA: acyl-ACP thioesterase domain-containing protein [Candidatus Limnocylindrales bacterium]|nr:acyl-ACP thioesterase domain-containing protein [Candidatus Limnocylindrales bacterium]
MDDRGATFGYRIRFDEAGSAGTARPSLLLRLAQDAAWIHSERIGYTRAWYEERGLAWLVRAVALETRGQARHGDVVDVSTSVIGYRRIWARRQADIRRAGDLMATVLTDWILTDDRGRPVRIPEEFATRLPGSSVSIRPLRTAERPAAPPLVEVTGIVRPSELDPLGHMNNAAYLDRVMDLAAGVDGAAWAGRLGRPSAVLEFLAPAELGDRTVESLWPTDDGRGISYAMTVIGRGPILRATAIGAAD